MRYLHMLFNLYFLFFYIKKYIEVAYIADIFLKQIITGCKAGLND